MPAKYSAIQGRSSGHVTVATFLPAACLQTLGTHCVGRLVGHRNVPGVGVASNVATELRRRSRVAGRIETGHPCTVATQNAASLVGLKAEGAHAGPEEPQR